MSKFLLVSSKYLSSLLKTLRPGSKGGAFSVKGYREPAARMRARRLEDLAKRLSNPALQERYLAALGKPVPPGKTVVSPTDFEELKSAVKLKQQNQKGLEIKNKGRKGTRQEGHSAHIGRDEEGWIAFDEVGQQMSYPYKARRDALREVKTYADWLEHSKHPEARLKRGSRLDPSSSDPLTRLLMDDLRKRSK